MTYKFLAVRVNLDKNVTLLEIPRELMGCGRLLALSVAPSRIFIGYTVLCGYEGYIYVISDHVSIIIVGKVVIVVISMTPDVFKTLTELEKSSLEVYQKDANK